MRELWIRSKYETRKFLRGESDPAPSKDALKSMLFTAIAENKPLEVMKVRFALRSCPVLSFEVATRSEPN